MAGGPSSCQDAGAPRIFRSMRRGHVAPWLAMAKLLALIAVLASPAGFHSSAKPLPAPVKALLERGGFWHRGCPVGLSGLRLLTVSHRGWDGRTHPGQLIVNAGAAAPLRR